MPSKKPRKPQKIVALEKANGNYGVGIEWDDMEKLHDLDLQAVIVNREGIIVDTVYYNNLTSMKGSITHSGDVSNGASEGVDESVWISLAHVPEEIWGAIFVVCAFSKGSRLKDVQNGRVVLMEGTTLNRLQVFNIERSVANADVVGLVKRTREGGWAFKEIDEPAEFGSHFVDIIEPWIGDVIRAEIPTAPAFQKISFVMDKGSVATFPADAVLKRIFVGIGGSLSPSQVEEVDIDAEAVFCDSDGHVIGAVDGENHSLFGVEHSGDSVVGHESMGDDEAITIDLAKIPSKVARIFIVLTVFNGTFELVEKAYARVLDQHSSQLVRFDIQAHEAYGGLLVAQLIRSDGAENRWGFQGLGKFFTCTAGWKSGASEIIKIAADTTVAVDPTAARLHNKTRSLSQYNLGGDGASSRPLAPPGDAEPQVSVDTGCLACGGSGCSMCRPTPTFRETALRGNALACESRASGARLAVPSCGNQASDNAASADMFASRSMGLGRVRLKTLDAKALGRSGSFKGAPARSPTADRMLTSDSDVILVRPPDETDGERPRSCTCFCSS